MCCVEENAYAVSEEKNRINKHQVQIYMIVRPHTAKITPTFSGFPAAQNDSLFSGNDFSPVIMGLARKQRVRDPLKQLFGYAFWILVRKEALTLQIQLYYTSSVTYGAVTPSIIHTPTRMHSELVHRQVRIGGEQAQTHAHVHTALHYWNTAQSQSWMLFHLISLIPLWCC